MGKTNLLSKVLENTVAPTEIAPDEAKIDRIAREFGVDWYDAYDAYRKHQRMWDKMYRTDDDGLPTDGLSAFIQGLGLGTTNLNEANAEAIAKEFGLGFHDAYDIYSNRQKFWGDAAKQPSAASTRKPPIVPPRVGSPQSAKPEASISRPEPTEQGSWDEMVPGRISMKQAQRSWRG